MGSWGRSLLRLCSLAPIAGSSCFGVIGRADTGPEFSFSGLDAATAMASSSLIDDFTMIAILASSLATCSSSKGLNRKTRQSVQCQQSRRSLGRIHRQIDRTQHNTMEE